MKILPEKLNLFRNKIIGTPDNFSMESRLFHSLCIIAFTGLSINAIVNFFLNRKLLAVLMILLFATAVFIYYLSRAKNKKHLSLLLFFTAADGLLIVNYYYGSGINGPTFLLAMLCLMLITAIVPKKQKRFWIALNFVTIISLLIIEYLHPALILQSYATREARFIDFTYAYILIGFLVFAGITFIRENYNYEKAVAERKAAELEKINEAKDKLLSIIAHDLRAPLNSIQTHLEVLKEVSIDKINREQIEKKLLNATINTSEMLTNLLMWAKAQMSGISVNLTNIYPAKVLVNTLEVQRSIAKEKGIELYQSIQQTLCIMADADMLQLVVRNLINNAIKFTPAGGEISVIGKNENNTGLIIIKDNGIGIPYENQKTLFSLKATSTYGTENEKGIGLGLMLCKNYIELQHGKIWFESAVGNGTCFYISLNVYA